MAIIISVCNKKGGVGKSSTTVNLSAQLAYLGYRTLVIDMDSQADSTKSLTGAGYLYRSDNPEPKGPYDYEITLTDSLEHPKKYPMQDLIIPARCEQEEIANLFLAPACKGLDDIGDRIIHDKFTRLDILLRKQRDNFDIIVIDCPPALGFLTFNALNVTDMFLIPIDGVNSLDGVDTLLDNIATMRYLTNEEVEDLDYYVFSSLRDARNTASNRDFVEELTEFLDPRHVFKTEVRRLTVVERSIKARKPLRFHKPGSVAMNAYRSLTKEVAAVVEKLNGR